MIFSKDDAKILKSGEISTILDLALCFPKNFDDFVLSETPSSGKNTVLIIPKSRNYKGALFIINAFCVSWECDIKIIIFNAKPWHYGTFKLDKEIYINGECSFAYNSWQFINPKITTKVGEILPRYKAKIKDDKLALLTKNYINLQNLQNAGLDEEEAYKIVKLHEISHENAIFISKIKENEEIQNLLKFVEILNYLQKLSKKKFIQKSQKVKIYDIKEWLENLPFKPTKDQIAAVNDIKNDLLDENAARRVVMGDVGSGKTLVILATALMVYPKPAILMAPTSILSEQLFDEANRLMPKFFKTKLLKSGEKNVDFDGVNLIISTTALLWQNLPISPVVMIDELHRFGSNQRDKIAKLSSDGENSPNIIQFSATPIPRTLTMIQSELVKFSFLKIMPFKKEIHSVLIQNNDFGELINHIKKEISKQKQIIVVYPLVEESERSHYQSLKEAQDFWTKNFKNVFVTYGSDKQKDEILREFRQNGDILLATTIVEIGISLPRLTTIIIVGAERLGLASLHQLRGRVGRVGGVGWCFLFTKLKQIPQRLKDFCDTQDGFKIAEIDLKNRQGGDLLDGKIQHGAIFEYYDYEEEITQKAKERLCMK